MEPSHTPSRPAGYDALLRQYGLAAIPNWHRSLIASTAIRRTESAPGEVIETYPSSYWPGSNPTDHLEFALRYDGTNLALLAILFPAIGAEEVTRFIQSKPTGKYARRIWYFFEMLTGRQLPIPDLKQGNYIDLLEPDEYITLERGTTIRRQRINDNLLGDARFCPLVRRTPKIAASIASDLSSRCKKLISAYPPELLKRALTYLYTKETRSSFEIEHITPDASRTERFISLLQAGLTEDLCNKPRLIELQNQIVDPRFKDDEYRSEQNYVGQAVGLQNERVHYVSPRPADVAELMEGLIASHARMEQGGIHPVIQAALVGYGFVFIHPFEDGNGRIHRLLIHNILMRRNFAPAGIIFPVSAVMLKQPAEYDASLEAFSRPILPLVEYTIDENGRMTVHNETGGWYGYPDMTAQAESLFNFIEQTIETELVAELAFLQSYDQTKRAMQEIVDMPDRDIDLFLRFCLQNNRKLSQRKRESHFATLTDEEIRRLEQAIAEGYK